MTVIPKHGSFGAIRKHDVHTGVDLYGNEGDPVFALEDGLVQDVGLFTGESVGSPWWEDTWYIGVSSLSGYIVYGEVTTNIEVGTRVKKGDLLGSIKRVLRRNKGKLQSMLHLELYTERVLDPVVWELGQPKPEKLENPTKLLIPSTEEFKAVERYYGSSKANRSRQLKIKHVIEGVDILNSRGADLDTQRAFCLHPLLQADEALQWVDVANFSPTAVLYAAEYRSVANAYLAHRQVESLEEIRLSPLPQVNEMLVADKIQNYRDFISYHKWTHARSKELDKYFNNWLKKLGII